MSRHVIEILQLNHRDIGFANPSRAKLHAPLCNHCSEMFPFPHFLIKLSKLAKFVDREIIFLSRYNRACTLHYFSLKTFQVNGLKYDRLIQNSANIVYFGRAC